MRQFELYAIITQPIALMSFIACQASGRLRLFILSRQTKQRLSMARYTTSTATEIQPQPDSNPVLTSASQVAGMRFKDTLSSTILIH